MIILDEVKAALGITSDYMDAVLLQYIREVKEYMLDAGVRQSIIESTSAKGLITRGVADLWNYGQGEAKLSDYFKERCIQMANKNCTCGCNGDSDYSWFAYLADLPVVDSLVEGDLFLVEKDRTQKAISSDNIRKYFKGDKGDTGNDAEIAGAEAHYEDTGAEEPSISIVTSGAATSRFFDFYFKDLRGPKGTSVESITTKVIDGVMYYVFAMNDGTSVEVAAPYVRFTDSVNITVDDTVGTPAGTASLTFETIEGVLYATINLSFTGLKGNTGDTGAQGEKGDKGDTGAQGEKGDKGDTYTITSADYSAIATEVIAQLGNAEEGSY